MTINKEHQFHNRTTLAASVALFLLAIVPRLIGLQQFVTADEAKWVYRSAQFWLALLRGDWAGTMVTLKPAATTMWSGGLGMWVYNRFHQNLPFAEFLASLPEWAVNPAVLHAARMPTVILSCVAVVLIFRLAVPMVGFWPAVLAGFLLALDPLFLAHSRFLHHDALVTLFAVPALLLAIRAAKGDRAALIGSAVLAGLAFLTKSPIFFLAPFAAALFLVAAWKDETGSLFERLKPAAIRFAMWGCIAYLTFVALWPAAWIAPVGAPLEVILDALREAAPAPDSDAFINLGVFYYPVYLAYYLSPVVLVGGLIWLFQRRNLSPSARYTTDALAWFALTFILFMTLSDKRSARYILPAFLPLSIIAAVGWHAWLHKRGGCARNLWGTGMLAAQLLAVAFYAPYYITYTNPLLGGPFTAPRLIKIGWGEGMEQVGAWLNQQPDAAAATVGAAYGSTLSPYFAGDVASPDSPQVDYVVSYIKQRQGEPPAIRDYSDAAIDPLTTVRLAGIDYARVYAGPPVQPIAEAGSVLAFRPGTNFAPIGQNWIVDLIGESLPPVSFSLQREGEIRALAGSEEAFDAPDVPARRTVLAIPADLSPGAYTLFAGDQSLGQVEARYAQIPPNFTAADVIFGGQVKLAGFNPTLEPVDGQLPVELAFSAAPKAWADYTIFVHLIDEAGERRAGHDAQPPRPTGEWLRGEVVFDTHLLDLPADLPAGTYRLRVGLYRADTGESLGESVILPTEFSISD